MSALDTPNAPAQGGAHISPIADLTYRNYDGPLKSRAVRWWIVALATIRANVNRNRFGYWIPVAIVFLWFLGNCIYFYFQQGIQGQLQSIGMPQNNLPPNPYTAQLYATMASIPLAPLFFNLPVFLAALIVGSSSIAADNRANALLVYLSKPLSRFDYLFGKWMGVFILLAAMVLAPSLLMFLFFAVTYSSDGFLKDNPTLIFKIILASLVPALLHSSLVIGISARSKSGRIAGVVYAAFYLVTGMLSLRIGNLLWDADKPGTHIERSSVVLHASVDGVRNGLVQHIYDVQPIEFFNPPDTDTTSTRKRRNRRRWRPRISDETRPDKWPERPPLWALLTIGGLIVLVPLAAAISKVRAVEVING